MKKAHQETLTTEKGGDGPLCSRREDKGCCSKYGVGVAEEKA